MNGFGTPGSKYVQMLAARQPGMNNGTMTGGLASALQQGLQGYLVREETEKEEARKQGLADALRAQLSGFTAAGGSPAQMGPPTAAAMSAAGPGMMSATPAKPAQQSAPGGMAGSNAPAMPNTPPQMPQSAPGGMSGAPAQGQAPNFAQMNPQVLATVQALADSGNVEQAMQLLTQEQGRVQSMRDQMALYKFQQDNKAQKPEDTFEVVQNPYGRGGVGQRNARTGQIVSYEGPPDPKGGPFEGTGMDAQVMNILLDPNANPSSPVYQAAFAHASQPKVTVDPQTGQITTISPDMSAFRSPAGQPVAASQAPGAPSQGGAIAVPGATVSTVKGKPPTEFNQNQSNAATYSDRMIAAEEVLSRLDTQGTDFMAGLMSKYGAGNYLQSPEYQQFDQAQRDFINAQLRQESGAVISQEEFENAARQYFPQPGDSPEVIEQKRRNRQVAIAGMGRAAGPAYQPPQQSQGAESSAPPAGGGSAGDDEALLNKYLGG